MPTNITYVLSGGLHLISGGFEILGTVRGNLIGLGSAVVSPLLLSSLFQT